LTARRPVERVADFGLTTTGGLGDKTAPMFQVVKPWI
jgi:hypothetical protein